MFLSQWLEDELEMRQEEVVEKTLQKGLQEGMEKGLVKGEKIAIIELICKKLKAGVPCENIADFLQEDIEYVKKIKEVGLKTEPQFDKKQVYDCLVESVK